MQNSNYLFTHDLDASGKIKRFLRLPDIGLQCVHSIEFSELFLDIGGDGVFLIDDGVSAHFLGNSDDLKCHFLENSYAGSVLEIEAALSLGDAARLKGGLASLDWIEGGDAPKPLKDWIALEECTFDAVQSARRQSIMEPSKSHNHEADFVLLTSEPESSGWSRLWTKLWHAGYKRDQLIKIACWREDSQFNTLTDSGQVYYLIAANSRNDEYVNKFCVSWLRRSGYQFPYWTNIATIFLRRLVRVEEIREVIFEKLHRDAASARSVAAWVRLWLVAWSYFGKEKFDELRDIAEINLSEHDKFTERHGEMFLFILRSDGGVDRYYEYIVDWLRSYKKNSVVWCDIFERIFSSIDSDEMIEIGVSWLRGWGGTVSAWLNIWRSLEKYISPFEHVEIAASWLNRARWDLRIWPFVFNECALKAKNTEILPMLIETGARWLNAGFGSRRGREDVEKLLSDLRQVK